jgi:hypothetical protein
MEEENIKECNNCGEIKPFSDFHRDANNHNGHKNICKVCCNEKKRVEYQILKEGRVRTSTKKLAKKSLKKSPELNKVAKNYDKLISVLDPEASIDNKVIRDKYYEKYSISHDKALHPPTNQFKVNGFRLQNQGDTSSNINNIRSKLDLFLMQQQIENRKYPPIMMNGEESENLFLVTLPKDVLFTESQITEFYETIYRPKSVVTKITSIKINIDGHEKMTLEDFATLEDIVEEYYINMLGKNFTKDKLRIKVSFPETILNLPEENALTNLEMLKLIEFIRIKFMEIMFAY